MTPLQVALLVKGTPATLERDKRNMGYWSYQVPEFSWDCLTPGVNFQATKYDLMFVEDGAPFPDSRGLPSIFMSIDSTLDELHYRTRIDKARRADLVLLDHDSETRFPGCRKVRQWNYCVNDHIFVPSGKSIDVNFRCSSGAHKGYAGGLERDALRGYLSGLCANSGWSYVSGTTGLDLYAIDMGLSKVVVNWPRTPINRPHRIFDAMACRCCIVTAPIPKVPGDGLVLGAHYVEYRDKAELPDILRGLLGGDGWERYADAGHKLVMENHTWEIRAAQLRGIIREEFGF